MQIYANRKSILAERCSASDLCSDGRVVIMWVRILAATVVPVSLCKTLTIIASLHPWGPLMVTVFD